MPYALLRRLLTLPLTLLGIITLVFFLIQALPGDPVAYFAGQLPPGERSPQALESLRQSRGLDQPLTRRYADYLRQLASFDLGRSHVDHRPVTEKIGERLPHTLFLNGVALLVAVVLALPLGVWLGMRASRRTSRIADLFLLLLFSLPMFWVALLLIDLTVLRLNLFPLFGMRSLGAEGGGVADRLRHVILPAICLAYVQLAVIARFTRSAVEEVKNHEFINAARARGLAEWRVVTRHILRNALVPLVTLFAIILPYLLSGSVIIERMFQWNGIGNLFFEAILARDYPVVMGLTLISATLVMFVVFVTDLLYAAVDPRIELSGEGR
jgi:peptide/nickel transport system permease protein